MEVTANSNNFARSGQDLADNAASKIQGGIRDSKQALDNAGDQLSGKVEDLRSEAKPLLKKLAGQAQTAAQTVTDATQKVRDSAGQATDSLITYTKENPVKAVLIAAAGGALLLTLINSLARSRD
jgi:ElaB/YqjD/DUF883 family membrane-anchored ribosome-binding protein